MGKIIVCFFLSLYTMIAGAFPLSASDHGPIRSLKVGDSIPELIWNLPMQLFEASTGGHHTFSLQELRDQELIILDFWATWCSPCISALSKLDDLKKELGEQLAVVPVTYESSRKVSPVYSQRHWSLPSVVEDTLLARLFPHRSIPHLVWIKDGRVLGITNQSYATAETISRILAGLSVDMIMKEEDMEFSRSKPLLIDGNGGGLDQLIYQSLISRSVRVNSGGYEFSNNGINVVNSQVKGLFSIAYQTAIPFTNIWNRIKIEVADSLKRRISAPEDVLDRGTLWENWKQENTFCYGLSSNQELSRQQILEKMRHDLNFYFNTSWGIEAAIERRDMLCYVLAIADAEKAKTYYSNGDKTTIEVTEESFSLTNRTLWPIANLLMDNHDLSMPIVVDTNITNTFDLKIFSSFKDFEAVKEELKIYGFELNQRNMTIDMLVIKQMTK